MFKLHFCHVLITFQSCFHHVFADKSRKSHNNTSQSHFCDIIFNHDHIHKFMIPKNIITPTPYRRQVHHHHLHTWNWFQSIQLPRVIMRKQDRKFFELIYHQQIPPTLGFCSNVFLSLKFFCLKTTFASCQSFC